MIPYFISAFFSFCCPIFLALRMENERLRLEVEKWKFLETKNPEDCEQVYHYG
jgi:hypothetical protein